MKGLCHRGLLTAHYIRGQNLIVRHEGARIHSWALFVSLSKVGLRNFIIRQCCTEAPILASSSWEAMSSVNTPEAIRFI